MLNFKRAKAFSLIEMLTVIGVIALLTAILVPALNASKNLAKMTLCKSNLRQLAVANQNYANDYNGYSVPGAIDIDNTNLHRWYGTRDSQSDPFDTGRGPLAPYLGDAQLQCPQKVTYTDLNPENELYENGNEGYGYNFIYIGSKIWESGLEVPDSSTSTKLTDIRQPQATLLFSDTAFAKQIDSMPTFIRYAFIEPRWFVVDKVPSTVWDPSPSIHFRHRNRACISWVDGHADEKKMGNYDGFNQNGLKPSEFDIGWFEPMDNSLFDLK